MSGHDFETAFCNVVPAASGRVLLMPWGDINTSNNEHLRMDDEAARITIDAFNKQGVDLVIDRDHLSEEPFATEDGFAPAMGWIKQGTMEAVPGEGLFGTVEWTPEGQRLVYSKAYKYLSPAAHYRKSDGVVVRLRSVGLVNKPAIPRMPALFNKERSNSTKENSMEPLLTYLREKAGLPADATAEQILAKCKETDAVFSANKSLAESLTAVAGELGDSLKPLADALKGSDPEAIANGLRLSCNRLSNDPAKVHRAELDALRAEINTLKTTQQAGECDTLISTNRTKLAPADEAWFRTTFAKDPEFARKWIKDAPEKVQGAKDAAGTGSSFSKQGSDRAGTVNKLKIDWDSQPTLAALCSSKRSFVDGSLISMGQAKLTDAEAVSFGI